MKNNVEPPCNSSLATSCAKSVMTSSCGVGKVAATFNEGVSSPAEWELAIDEAASTVNLAQNVCVVPRVSAAVREGDECVKEFVDHLRGEKNAARHFVLEGEADDNDNFVGIVSGITAVGDNSRRAGILRTRWYVQFCRWKCWQRVLSSFFIAH